MSATIPLRPVDVTTESGIIVRQYVRSDLPLPLLRLALARHNARLTMPTIEAPPTTQHIRR